MSDFTKWIVGIFRPVIGSTVCTFGKMVPFVPLLIHIAASVFVNHRVPKIRKSRNGPYLVIQPGNVLFHYVSGVNHRPTFQLPGFNASPDIQFGLFRLLEP